MKRTFDGKKLFSLLTTLVLIFPLLILPVHAATTVSVLDGQISVTGDFYITPVLGTANGSISVTDNVVTATATGYKSANTTTVTITNATSTAAKITFDYSLSNYSSFSEDSASGDKAINLDAGASTTMSFACKSAWSNQTATLTLSNFTYTAAAASSEVTFDYTGGTVTVNGNTIGSGSSVDISSEAGAPLVATPNSGYTFLGWVNGNTNMLISTASSYTLYPVEDMAIKAAFGSASSKPWFKVGDYLVDDLNKAVTLGKIVIPVYDGTLPSGNYTIPSGVTLLIPYDSANTLCTNKPTLVETYTTPSAYRTLTMTNGANITVNGAISISGSMSSKWAYHGMPTGPLGFLQMNSGSTITVNNGGTLYAWGYIKGSGNVTVNSGGTVYECFQLPDFRGGDATSNMTSDTNANTYGVFPFNQYYVQNVEVPMTLYAGANDKGFLAVHVTLVGIQSAEVPFIGTDCMFSVTDGYIVKDYREGTGRTDLKIYGDVALSPITLSMKVTTIGSVTIESEKYELPIPNHYSIYLESGRVTINQNVALLPGSEVYIRNDTNCVLGEGVSVYVYDLAQWGTSEISYASRECYQYEALPYVPGGNGTVGRLKDALLQVDGTLDASKGYIYVTEDGANICSTGSGVVKTTPGTETITYQVIQYKGISADADDTDIQYVGIPITTAKLLNSDSTYLQIGTNTYTYDGTNWRCETHTDADEDSVCDVCGYVLCHHSNTEVQNAADATCTEDGYTGDTVCTDCGKTIATGTTIQSTGSHSYESTTTDATCTVNGTTDYTCTACGDSYSETIASAGHSGGAATCTAKAVCSTCGEEYGQLAAHAWDEGAVTTEPTCTAAGVKTFTCSCGDTYTEEVVALGHDIVTDAAVDATCTETGLTEGSHCSVCGEVLTAQNVVPALGHSYNSVVTAPTCTEKGYTTYTCSACGDSYTADEVAATSHSYTSKVTTALTCTEKGVKTFTCSCGDTYTEEVVALGHDEESHEAQATTCTEIGWDAYVTCSRCDYSTYVEKSALGHDMVTDSAVDATCTTTGLTEGSHCSRCNDATIAQEVVDALGHTEVTDSAVDATCTATGLTEGKHCSVCDEVLVAQTVVAALGHTEVIDAAVDATCTETGLTEGSHCSVCGEVLTAQNVVPALGHSYNSVVTAPTFDAQGYTTHTCAICGDSYVDSYVDALTAVAQIGDEPYVSLAAAFAAAKDGNTIKLLTNVTPDAYLNVTTAGKITLDLNGHEITREGTGIYVNNVSTELTITGNGGITAQHAIWAAAGKVTIENGTFHGTDVTVYTSGTGKVVINGGTFSADATDGVGTADKYCVLNQMDSARETSSITVCGGTFKGFDPANNASEGANTNFCAEGYCAKAEGENYVVDEHDYSEVVTVPTCTEAGYTTHTCERCDDSYTDTEVAALGHTEAIDAAVVATCTETGLTAGKHCSVCDEVLVAQEVVDALGHTEVIDAAVAATCTTTGLTEGKHCSVCDEVLVAQTVVDALGHTEVTDVAVAATCTETGLTEGKHCSVCSEVLVAQEVVDALGHTEVIDAAVEATCTATGLTEGKHCSVCDEVLVAQEVVDALGHTEVIDAAVAATCTTTGLTEGKHCSVCDEVLVAQTVVDALGHTEVTDVAVAATCTETGLTEGKHCSACGEVLVAQEEIPALGHTEVTDSAVDATCTETGLTEGKRCGTCGEVLVAQTVVEALGHTDAIDAAVEATCTTTGLTEGKHCGTCGEVLVAQTVVAALGHTDVIDAAVEATCTTTGQTEGKHCSVCDEVLVAQEVVAATGHTASYTYGDGTVTVRIADVEALEISTFITDMDAETLMAKIDFCAEFAAESSYFNHVIANECYKEFVWQLTGSENAENTRLFVFYVANAAENWTADEVISFVSGNGEGSEITNLLNEVNSADEGLTKAALAYGMYVAYAYNSGDAELIANTESASKVHGALDNDGFHAWLTTDTAKTAAEGYLAALKIIRENMYVEEVRNDVLNSGFNNITLVGVINQAIGDTDHTCGCGEIVSECVNESVVTEPTCTEAGYTTHTCLICGKSYVDDETDALDHSFTSYEESGDLETAICDYGCGATDTRVAESHEGTQVEVVPEVTDTTANVTMDTGLLGDIADKDLELHLNSEILELVFDNGALKQILADHSGKSNVSIVVENTTPAETTGKLVFDIHLKVDDVKQESSQFGEGSVTVTIPLDSLKLTDKQTVKVWYVERNADGTEKSRTPMEEGFNHDRENGKVQFKTNHFSEYEVEVVDEETDTSVTINNNTNGAANVVAAEKGAVGNDYTITVTCDVACVVAYTTDGGETYFRMTAIAVEGQSNTYSFTVNLEEGMSFVVAMKGDVNKDGVVDIFDVTNLSKVAAGKKTLNADVAIAAYINSDTEIDIFDVTNLSKVAAGNKSLNW